MDVLLFLLTVGAFMVSFREEAPDWWQLVILSLFVLCFVWRWYIASDRGAYIRSNWLDLVFVVLLASPVLRLFTVFKFARLAPALRLGVLMRKHRTQLLKLILLSRDSFPVAMALVFGMVFLFGTSTYLLEYHQNPSFSSVSDGLWWAFVTLTTVGYGDIVPVTEAGRIIAALTMAFGIAVYSLLIANLTHFLETLEGSKEIDKTDS
ncbi:MAG: hypothetical protein BMS9Abin18_0891 [Zetaproteobacteria bacterium]|nr:MAG: hypothetical protein BMS9Abin18_0891 [Zetaproteobacteria bacterium]